jgi:hypothetical protein
MNLYVLSLSVLFHIFNRVPIFSNKSSSLILCNVWSDLAAKKLEEKIAAGAYHGDTMKEIRREGKLLVV